MFVLYVPKSLTAESLERLRRPYYGVDALRQGRNVTSRKQPAIIMALKLARKDWDVTGNNRPAKGQRRCKRSTGVNNARFMIWEYEQVTGTELLI
jgi:hypothetical protein